MTEYKTRLGALKAALEWSKPGKYIWLVEGYRIELFDGYYVYEPGQTNGVKDAPKFDILVEAFEYIAKKTHNDRTIDTSDELTLLGD